MVYTEVITKDGIEKIMQASFLQAVSAGDRFGYMAVGTQDGDFTTESQVLHSECNPVNHPGYERVATTNTITKATGTVKIEGLFDVDNIATVGTTDIKEIGLVNEQALGTGVFLTLAEIPAMPKSQDLQLRYEINIIFGED